MDNTTANLGIDYFRGQSEGLREVIAQRETTIHGLMAENVTLKGAMEVIENNAKRWHIAYDDIRAQVQRLSEAALAAEGNGGG